MPLCSKLLKGENGHLIDKQMPHESPGGLLKSISQLLLHDAPVCVFGLLSTIDKGKGIQC